MSIFTDCAVQSGIAPFAPSAANPWNAHLVRHVMRRMGFGVTPNMVQEALNYHPVDWVNNLIDDAEAASRPTAPSWANQTLSQYSDFQTQIQSQILEWAIVMVDDMIENPLRAKLNLFWSNHFVTKLEAYACPSWMYQYWKVLDDNSFGNFKSFTKSIGITPAMLVFLNGVQNNLLNPNENYARELFELFTLGRDRGYTQADITNAARALTGFNGFTELCAPIGFIPLLHDSGFKTIFGQTARFDYNTLHDHLFNVRAQIIAEHICEKLYRTFISPEVDFDFVRQLAQIFLQNNFELVPVYRALFSSERFFDPLVRGTIIKSPIEYLMMFANETDILWTQDLKTLMLLYAGENGQLLFNPPDVAGWRGDKDWINTSKLTQRWLTLELLVYYLLLNQIETLRDLPQKLSNEVSDPAKISADIVDFYLPFGLQKSLYYDQAAKIFKWEVPENYYQNGEWNVFWPTVPPQVAFLLQHVIRTPEFQLM